MAKRKSESAVAEEPGDRIQYVAISTETRRRYLNYAMSVIQSRALPDVRDGLKPVQRRILYVMHEDLGLVATAKPRKCAKITGDTTGNYHPHGTIAVYDTLVRLAQDFTLRCPLIDGQGNFGSVMGLPAAAERYTEARLTAVAEQLMAEMRYDTVDMRPTYDNVKLEPVVLPARFPHLLVNGCAGIAVGMATNIPPHNLREVVDACLHMIDSQFSAPTKDLLKFVKGPDFPLGGRMMTDRKTLRTIYEEGRGAIKVRAEWKLDRETRDDGTTTIVVHNVPYGVETGPLAQQIGDVIASRKLPQLLEVHDETDDQHGLRIALELKAGADPDSVMAYLYKHTSLEQNFNYNATCLIPNEQRVLAPARVSLSELLQHFLKFRLETVRRRIAFQLAQLERRIHILEGFEIIFGELDRAIKIIRNSEGKRDAAERLMKAFPLDEEQTTALLELQLYRISQLEITTILAELNEKRKEADRLRKLLASEKKLWDLIKSELSEVAEKHGDKRRTTLGSSDEIAEFDASAYIIRENTNVVLTKDGWIKRVGRLNSVESTRVREGDRVLDVAPGSTLDAVIFFSSEGVAYTLPIDQIPASSGYGEPLSKHVKLHDGAQFVAAITTDARFTPSDEAAVDDQPAAPYFLACTARGQMMRLPLSPFRAPSTRNGRKFCKPVAGDRVVAVALVREATSLFLVSRQARLLHFAVDSVPVLSGAGKGVRGIKLEPGDEVIGWLLVQRPGDTLRLRLSSDKELVCGQQKYAVMGRGGRGWRVSQRNQVTEIVADPIQLVDWTSLESDKDKAPAPSA